MLSYLQFYSVHFIGYNLASIFRLRFCLEIYKLFTSPFLLEVGRNYHSTQFWTRLFLFSVFLFSLFAQFDPGLTSNPAHIFRIRFFDLNPVRLSYFVRMSSQPTGHFSVSTFDCLYHFGQSFSLQCPPNFILLGTSAHPTFGPCLHFLRFPPWLVRLWQTLSLQLQLLRLNFAPRMRRKLTSGSASSRPNSQRQASDHKNSSMGSPVDTCLHPWLTVKPVGLTPVTLYSVCI